MKLFVILCLASAVFANKLEKQLEKDIAKAKHALDQLTFSKEEHIYDVEGYVDEANGGYENTVTDPCMDFACRIGWECVVDPINREPFCDCARSCPIQEESRDETTHRSRVCSTSNTTYTNLCDFHRRKCLSADMNEEQVDYYGGCAVMAECTRKDLREYPTRITEWFLESLEYLMGQEEEFGGLSQKEREILREPRGPESQAIFWKFRRLDKNPADLYLDFMELEALRAPIVLLEPCTKPFLEMCDANKDQLISAIEFGRCLNLAEEDIQY
ncbi:SPARC-like [Diadema setosum]|uniref:SPARC-like n=1 Tax=Diadema setosum TaxID=31175 RepID=UPI003B3AF0A1